MELINFINFINFQVTCQLQAGDCFRKFKLKETFSRQILQRVLRSSRCRESLLGSSNCSQALKVCISKCSLTFGLMNLIRQTLHRLLEDSWKTLRRCLPVSSLDHVERTVCRPNGHRKPHGLHGPCVEFATKPLTKPLTVSSTRR